MFARMSRAPRFSIILAGGKGTRMQSATCHKVCFPIAGKPAINRAIEVYNACGIQNHVIVVGALAGQVIETVGREFSNVVFAYQSDQLGTANATAVGLRAIETFAGPQEAVLVVPGDRLIEPEVIEQLFNVFYSEECDLALLAIPRNKSSGRLVPDQNGALLAIVEVPDIRQRSAFLALREQILRGTVASRDEARTIVEKQFAGDGPVPAPEKFSTAFGPLWDQLTAESGPVSDLLNWIPESLTYFEFYRTGEKPLRLSPSQVDEAQWVNVSVYLIKAGTLRRILSQLNRDNAQKEEYLTDMVHLLVRERRIRTDPPRIRFVTVKDLTDVLGYNNPAELLEVETIFEAKRRKAALPTLVPSRWYCPIRAWLDAFGDAKSGSNEVESQLLEELRTVYGTDREFLAERIAAYRALLRYSATVLGPEEPVFLVRSPGRLNVMGRHIDHQGGHCNLMTIGMETLIAVHPRTDDRIRLINLDKEKNGDREFRIGRMLEELPWDDWLSLVNSEKVANLVKVTGGDWSQYIRAAVLRLQKKFTNRRLIGMDLVASGNIPPAAGLSSSSSLVVGAAEATIAVNQLNVFPAQFVDLCGEGEWFVGTRGGSADHAAVKLGQRGKVIKVVFFEFAVQAMEFFPKNYVMVVCDSGIRAHKTVNARDQFNHRVACYRLGLRLIRRQHPQFAPLLHHLRDVNVRNLRVPLATIYRILLRLPEAVTREEIQALLPGEELGPIFATHQPPEDGLYPLRGVVLFGLAECERARRYTDILRRGQIDVIGRLMNISHDGDRVMKFGPDGKGEPFRALTSNHYLLNLLEDLESGDPERVQRAQLEEQPGSYHCSIPAIDQMVDIALRSEGVQGAQLAGAGLGGCMMVLVHRDAVRSLIENMKRCYYEPNRIAPTILVCTPIAGAGILLREEL
ncbi:MAG: NTP transferase domain-containing protein [Kiritimatiellia bacterium]